MSLAITESDGNPHCHGKQRQLIGFEYAFIPNHSGVKTQTLDLMTSIRNYRC